MKKIVLILLIISFYSCKKESNLSKIGIAISTITVEHTLINPTGKTIKTRFKTPKGFDRIQPKENSFQQYLQNPNYKGIDLYIIHYPKTTHENRVFQSMCKVYKETFKDTGLMIHIGIDKQLKL